MMHPTTMRIAREEWRLLLRNRVAVTGLALLLVLAVVAAFTSWDSRTAAAKERERHQAQVDHEFDAQPDRHPHRMVHYGHFVFRPPNPLAAFDPGIEAYAGHTLFLEGHRQNSANFGEVRQSSLLLRFGQLTPASVLQVLAPLLLIFLGHAVLSREREAGTLRVLLAQGVAPRQLVGGKLVALLGVAVLMLLPAFVALAAIGHATPAVALPALVLTGGYAVWMLIWSVGIVAASAFFRRSRDALIVLLAVWAISVVLVPRLAAEAAAATAPLSTRFETDIAVARDLAALGDSHNPDDPHFAEFRRKVLASYGVERIEDLPVNYKGLVSIEGERLTSALFARYSESAFERQHAQLRRVDGFALLSPVIALRRLSMATAGTDLHSEQRFVEAAEAHRYRLVQALNHLQAEKFSTTGDRSSRDDRIDRQHWHGLADFRYAPVATGQSLRNAAPAALVLLAWLGAMAGTLALAIRTVGRAAR